MTTHEVAIVEAAMPDRRDLEVMIARRELIREAIGKIMIDGHHYGVIPGTEGPAGADGKKKQAKKVLLKPGAEALCNLFHLTPTFDSQIRELPGDHREIRCTCTLTHRGSGAVVAAAAGSCSTMESKYRWRLASRTCPECDSEAIRKSKKGDGGFYCWTKLGGCGAQFEEGDKRIIDQELGRAENSDITDAHHTVLMMAQKRALVAATRLALAASDLFMDEEATDDDGPDHEEQPRNQRRRQSQPRNEPAKQEPRTPLTKKQELMRVCVRLKEQLLGAGRTAAGIADLMVEKGLTPPNTWADLDEETLEMVANLFQTELSLTGGARS